MRALIIRYRRFLVTGVHLCLIPFANILAFLIRFDGAIPDPYVVVMAQTLPVLVAARGILFVRLRLYQSLWRYTDVWDLRDLVIAIVASSALFYAAISWLWTLPAGYPRSVLVIDALLLAMLLAGLRLVRRLMSEAGRATSGRKVLIVGAGDAGETVAREMKKRSDYEPIGFVDDDVAKLDRTIHGVRVLGSLDDLPRIMETERPEEVLVAVAGPDATALRRDVIQRLERFTARITTLPSLDEMVSGTTAINQIRQLSIDDLLPRAPVDLDPAPLRRLIRGQRVLVTGAGGSIGSELCRQIAALRPATLVLYERHENSLYAAHNDVSSAVAAARCTGTSVHACLGDVTDSPRLEAVLTEHRPNIVFHAAAHKHVPLMEDNPCEAVKNNVRGTRLLVEAADRHGVDRFIMISTDKAVNPTSVMGATKRIGERIVRAQAATSRTSFSIVRFGNVLGSNGSVLPRFVEQITAGGPVTVTDPGITRYFMLIPEAVELVLHAAADGAPGATYVLDMGDPIKVADLAATLIRLAGHTRDDIPIVFTGLRPGEKMHEELIADDEVADTSSHHPITRVTSHERVDPRALSLQVSALELVAEAGDTTEARRLLWEVEPDLQGVTKTDAVPHDDAKSSATVSQGAGDVFGLQIETALKMEATSETEAAKPESVIESIPATIAPGLACPACRARDLRRSRVQTASGRLRRRFTTTRPHRCRQCGWHGWLEPQGAPGGAPAAITEPPPPNLAFLDQVTSSTRSAPTRAPASESGVLSSEGAQ